MGPKDYDKILRERFEIFKRGCKLMDEEKWNDGYTVFFDLAACCVAMENREKSGIQGREA